MLACVDVSYLADRAFAGCVTFQSWRDAAPSATFVGSTLAPQAYQPGAFYLRELPPILAALAMVPDALSTILVDGYVWLGGSRPGLGARLHAALGERVAVVGVAKTKWHSVGPAPGTEMERCRAIAITRGGAIRPLYVTAIGIDVELAAKHVEEMHGPYRIPTLLKTADRLSRRAAAGAT